MSSVYNNAIIYEGQVAQDLYSAMLVRSRTIESGLFREFADVRKEIRIPRMETNVTLQEYGCTVQPDSVTSFDDITLTICLFQWGQELCKQELDQVAFYGHNSNPAWAEGAGPGVAGIGPSQNLLARLGARIEWQIGNQIEMMIWRGGTGFTSNNAGVIVNLSLCNGWLARILDSAGYIEPIGASGDLTDPLTVAAEFEKMYNAMTPALYQSWALGEDADPMAMPVFFVSLETHRAIMNSIYAQAVIGTTSPVNLTLQTPQFNFELRGKELYYRNIRIFATWAIPPNYGILTNAGNLLFGYNLASDMADMKIVDLEALDPRERKIFISGAFSFGTQIMFPGEIILYRP